MDDEKSKFQQSQTDSNSPVVIEIEETESVENVVAEQEEETAQSISDISSMDRESLLEVIELLDEPEIGTESTVAANDAFCVNLTGTHTTSTDVDAATKAGGGGHDSFYHDHKRLMTATVESEYAVKQIVGELINPVPIISSCPELLKTGAKKRQQNEMSGARSVEIAKRMRSEVSPGKSPIVTVAEETMTTQPAAVSCLAIRDEYPERSHTDVLRAFEEYLEAPSEARTLTPSEADEPETPPPLTPEATAEAHPAIAERFKQIMDMFDNFTRNLESLDFSADKKSPRMTRKKRNNSKDAQPSSPCVHKSRYDGFLEAKREHRMRTESEKPSELSSTDASESGLQREARICFSELEILQPPPNKVMATTTSYPAVSAHNPPALQASVHIEAPKRDSLASQNAATIGCQTSFQHHLEFLHRNTANSISAARLDMRKFKEESERFHSISNESSNLSNNNNNNSQSTKGARNHMAELSGFTLVKVSEPPSMLELAPLTGALVNTTTAPCERTFHTIHIDATASPTPSAMQRPPLCVRLWSVIADFCAAVCLCLQVNKDCIFCLGFFIAFVVSASFLTAFFYRTLSVNPQLFHQPNQQYNDRFVPIRGTKEGLYVS